MGGLAEGQRPPPCLVSTDWKNINFTYFKTDSVGAIFLRAKGHLMWDKIYLPKDYM